jgi:carbonic anhydrase/acetyltransferase-like protein (isoleucine patch superfamily)
MAIFEFEGRVPRIPESCYVDKTATIIGFVELGEECFIGPGARIKGDYGHIRIGDCTSVQENCVIHARPGCETNIGSCVTVGHGAVLHGTTVGDNTVIGMAAVVPDDVRIGEYCIVAEGSVLANGTNVPDRSVVMGVPGKVRKSLTPDMEQSIHMSSGIYRNLGPRYKKSLKEITREDAAQATGMRRTETL